VRLSEESRFRSDREITAAELIRIHFDDIVIERMVIDILANAVNIRKVLKKNQKRLW